MASIWLLATRQRAADLGASLGEHGKESEDGIDSPLLFLTSRILETEPYRSDRFEVGFGLATRNRLAPRLGAIRFREKGILLCSSTSLGAPGP
jgi:hypothetical protein